jgi:hypothetical protein
MGGNMPTIGHSATYGHRKLTVEAARHAEAAFAHVGRRVRRHKRLNKSRGLVVVVSIVRWS